MGSSKIETFRGRRNTPACKLAFCLLYLGVFAIGYVLGEIMGWIGWIVFMCGSIAMFWMPTVYIVEVKPKDEEAQ